MIPSSVFFYRFSYINTEFKVRDWMAKKKAKGAIHKQSPVLVAVRPRLLSLVSSAFTLKGTWHSYDNPHSVFIRHTDREGQKAGSIWEKCFSLFTQDTGWRLSVAWERHQPLLHLPMISSVSPACMSLPDEPSRCGTRFPLALLLDLANR